MEESEWPGYLKKMKAPIAELLGNPQQKQSYTFIKDITQETANTTNNSEDSQSIHSILENLVTYEPRISKDLIQTAWN